MRILALAVLLAGPLKPPIIHEPFTPLPCPRHAVSTVDMEGCGEQKVLRSDRRIDTDVKAIFGLLAQSERRGFVAGEVAWLRYRRLSCNAEATKFAGGTLGPVDDIGCVEGRNRSHLEDLAGTLTVLRQH